MLEVLEGVEGSHLEHLEHLEHLDSLEHLSSAILPPMLRDRLLHGMWIGVVAAAATAGALIGFGSARAVPLQPLNAVAHILVGSRAFYVQGAHLLVTSAAVVVHVLAMALCGVAFAWAFGRWRGARLWGAAIAFVGLVAVFDFILLPERLSPGFESVLTRTEVIVVYGVMAIAIAFAASRTPVVDGL